MPLVPIIELDGQKVRELRKHRGIRVTDLARLIARSRQTIWNIEGSESSRVSDVLANQIANALEVQLTEIQVSEQPPPPLAPSACQQGAA